MLKSISTLLIRDLTKLRSEIESYANEDKLWVTSGDVTNSAGNLCMHLTGNLRHYVGHVLGGGAFERDRHAEFNNRNIPRAELLSEVDITIEEVAKALQDLDADALHRPYPHEVFGYEMTTEFFLIHLHGHLNYHLGQINYHRRIIGS